MYRSRLCMRVAAVIVVALTVFPAITLAQSRSPVAPTRQQVETIIQEAFEKFKSDTSGKNADYIPYLAQVDPKLFGIAIVTTDNQILTRGM